MADDISDPVVIERGSIVVEGAGQRAIGMGAEGSIGMYLSGRSNVTLVNIEITRFNYRTRLYYSSNNRIFHNNFNDNIRQTYIDPDGYNAWDDGYHQAETFWSDYAGVDTDGDGIGDTPYVIDQNNKDYHPLIKPYVVGDSNHDGKINYRDLFLLARAYRSAPNEPNWNPCVDFNDDKIVDCFDLTILKEDYGRK